MTAKELKEGKAFSFDKFYVMYKKPFYEIHRYLSKQIFEYFDTLKDVKEYVSANNAKRM
jgi:hypothetical protein